jgi:CheY-like chemotaxis protein
MQLDEAKAPAQPFKVRCPKCQTSVSVQLPEAPAGIAERPAFERPQAAPPFKAHSQEEAAPALNAVGATDLARLLAEALHQAEVGPARVRASKRPVWERRKALVCASPAYREAIALSLPEYEVFVAENMPQALGRMREERMDVVVLDANFDPVEQGVAFVTREVKLLRPSERRRLFLVYLTAGVRTMDLHAAFLHNVNLVINPSDLEQLPEALESSIRHFNVLYRDFKDALGLAPV